MDTQSGHLVDITLPSASIIIAIDPFHPVASFIQGLSVQSHPFDDFEVIVVDSIWRPSLWEAIESAKASTGGALCCHYAVIDKAGRAALNNHGVGLSRSDLIVFVSNDFILNPGCLSAHICFHRGHGGREAVGIGPALFSDDFRHRSPFMRWIEDSGNLFGYSFSRDDPARFPDNFFGVYNTSINKDFLLSVGGFDEDFTFAAWEDLECGKRLEADGMQVHLIQEAEAIHDHDLSFSERAMAVYRAGKSVAGYQQKTGSNLATSSPMWRFVLESLYRQLAVREGLKETFWSLALKASFLGGYLQAAGVHLIRKPLLLVGHR